MRIHLNNFIKEAIDQNKLAGLNEGVYTFKGIFIVDGYVRDNNGKTTRSNYAIWDYLGEPRLVDYDVDKPFSREFGDWPIITDVKWSTEVNDAIVVTTKPWEYEDKEYGRSFEEE